MRDMPSVSSQKRVPSVFTARKGMSAMEPGPPSKSWSILVWVMSSMAPPAHTAILWPSPVLFICLRPRLAKSGR